MKYQKIIDSCFCGDAAAKLDRAEELTECYGQALLQDNVVIEALAKIRILASTLDTQMGVMDMGSVCSACAARVDGCCCSAYMGNENNDALLLLMNRLSGIEVSLVCDNGVECCFLGERGCTLLLKPVFCLNYLCAHIRDRASSGEIILLEQKSGALLTAQYQFEQLLIDFLQH